MSEFPMRRLSRSGGAMRDRRRRCPWRPKSMSSCAGSASTSRSIATPMKRRPRSALAMWTTQTSSTSVRHWIRRAMQETFSDRSEVPLSQIEVDAIRETAMAEARAVAEREAREAEQRRKSARVQAEAAMLREVAIAEARVVPAEREAQRGDSRSRPICSACRWKRNRCGRPRSPRRAPQRPAKRAIRWPLRWPACDRKPSPPSPSH